MVSIKCIDLSLLNASTGAIAYGIEEGDWQSKELQEFAGTFFPTLHDYFNEQEFTGKAGQVIALTLAGQKGIKVAIFLGIGKEGSNKTLSVEQLRRALGSLIKYMQTKKIYDCTLALPQAGRFGISEERLAKEITISSNMGMYRFDQYITDEKRVVNKELALVWSHKGGETPEIKKGIHEGTIIAHSVNKVRYWIDLPPTALTPVELADKAIGIAKTYNLSLTVFDEAQVKEMGMGGLASVSAGSEQDCRFAVLEYKTDPNAPTIALVGKGITFDSGGLSIKPAQHMETMKEDMSGAAAVIGTMEALAQLKPHVNVIGIAPLSENLPSGKSTKPGDIIRFYNGKTAEVKNTDAEGRLILADALSYAVKHYKLDAVIDIATLTGACAYALGPFFTGMMGKDEALLKKVEEAGKLSGDLVWRLPFDDDYNKAIVSDVADICNIGKQRYMAGAITAGFFLSHFVNTTPWVHLDIAGTAFNVPDRSYYDSGATGVGVRLFIELLMSW